MKWNAPIMVEEMSIAENSRSQRNNYAYMRRECGVRRESREIYERRSDTCMSMKANLQKSKGMRNIERENDNKMSALNRGYEANAAEMKLISMK